MFVVAFGATTNFLITVLDSAKMHDLLIEFQNFPGEHVPKPPSNSVLWQAVYPLSPCPPISSYAVMPIMD